MANQLPSRYSVTPLGGLDVGTKLENIIEGGKQQFRMKQWQDTAPGIIKGGNPDEIANLMIKFPEMHPQIAAASGHKDEAMLKKSTDLSKSILTGGADPKQALVRHIQEGQARGEDVTKYMNVLGKELQNPGAAKDWADKWYALTDPNAHQAYKRSIAPDGVAGIDVASIKEMEYLTQGLTPEEKQKAKRVKLGLTPRASESAQIKAEKSFATEVAKLTAQLKISPKVAGAVAAAKNQSKIESDIAVKDKSDELAWSVYDNAVSNLSRAMQGTITGPLLGFIPAVTANQQIADGAVAIMAPVLKDMFRSAGEGTFTKEDQAILMEMLPTRKDKPKARVAKLQAVDSMIKVKLGVDISAAPAAPAAPDIVPVTEMTDEELMNQAFGGQ